MDEYSLEISELRRRIAKLKFDRAPLDVIEELEAQLRILKAIYDATWMLFQGGERDARLPARFQDLGLGSWTSSPTFFVAMIATLGCGRGTGKLGLVLCPAH